MKKTDAFVKIFDFVTSMQDKVDPEAYEIFAADIEKMVARDKVAKDASAVKAAARRELLDRAIEVLKVAGAPMPCKEICTRLADETLTPQKLSYTLKEGVKLGLLERGEDGKNVVYSV